MKKRFVFLLVLLAIAILIFNIFDKDDKAPNFEPLEIEVGEKFDYLNYNKDMYVLNYEIADLNNDGEKEIVLAIGEKIENSDSFKNIDIVVYDKSTGGFTIGKLKNYEGSKPKIYIKDVDGDSLQDVAVITNLKNESNSLRIVSFKSGEGKEIFKDKNGKGLGVSGQILDGFKAKIMLKNLKKDYTIDLVENKGNYISSGFYSENGKLKTDKINVTSAGIYDIEFINVDNKIGVKYTERIKGFDNLDIIEQITVIMKYEGGNWIVLEANGERIGKII